MHPTAGAAQDLVREEMVRIAPRMHALAREMHRQPELGCREVHAVTLLTGNLEEEGFHVETGIAGLPTAFRAERGRGGGPTVAILAEYDALPGLGHACGHNLIGAVACGAAVALARALDVVPGRVLVFGAPAEETIGGKVVLAARGAFEGVDAALLAHPGSEDRSRVCSLASWSMEVTFEGRSAHAVAAPEEGVNALDAMIQLFVARDALLKALRPEVRIPGVILDGGRRANVIPDHARARFSLRAADTGYLAGVVLERFRGMVEGVARATGTRAKLAPIDNLYDEMLNNPVLAELYDRRMGAEGLELPREAGRPIGSLDMGTLSHMVPALHPIFRITERPLSTHTPEFTEASLHPRALDAAVRAARTLALVALDLVADPAALARARAAHAEQTAGWQRVEAAVITEQAEP
ncbi:MAG: amidohydrolase [Acidobacteria bacterium]|nr:amidohydrolase [Acidobacteriota bacterium]